MTKILIATVFVLSSTLIVVGLLLLFSDEKPTPKTIQIDYQLIELDYNVYLLKIDGEQFGLLPLQPLVDIFGSIPYFIDLENDTVVFKGAGPNGVDITAGQIRQIKFALPEVEASSSS